MTTAKLRKPKSATSLVVTESPPLLFQFADKPATSRKKNTADAASRSNGSAAKKKQPMRPHMDRSYLKDIEVFLNNAINLAERIEHKNAAKLCQSLREARELAIELRG